MHYLDEYNRWLENVIDEDLQAELKSMGEAAIEDAFYRDLAFGTGGLRGVIGAGTNRMNIYTVARASQGLAHYVLSRLPFPTHHPSIAVSYDSRVKSLEFAQVAAGVFAANGMKVHLYPELMPTPCLSYAVRSLRCDAGIMVTASHNPSKYNGYKVYDRNGCQITTEAATKIQHEIGKLDIFKDLKSMNFHNAVNDGDVEYIKPDIFASYLEEVKKQSVLFGDEVNREATIIYTPLNGTGLKPVTRVLKESGFTNITVVSEQEYPDGNFPTCQNPNPELREAMELGLQYCEKLNADLLLATDPDCDRCGVAVKEKNGYRLLSGNEIGLLLFDFICSQRQKHNKMPDRPVFVKTIVTTDLAEKIADHYGAETINVLTGFKYIGEVIGRLESEAREDHYICGFEESYGYLTGTYVRDKDAVNAAFMICEMFAYYKFRNVSMLAKLEALYDEYGYCLNTLRSYDFAGSDGMAKMQEIMNGFRSGIDTIGGYRVEKTLDYSQGLTGLPKSDVLKFFLANGCSVVIRPSGTEPKLKSYVSVMAVEMTAAEIVEKKIVADLKMRMQDSKIL